MRKGRVLARAKMAVEVPGPSMRDKDARRMEKWERPQLEDVSGKVMAQPYIRFT